MITLHLANKNILGIRSHRILRVLQKGDDLIVTIVDYMNTENTVQDVPVSRAKHDVVSLIELIKNDEERGNASGKGYGNKDVTMKHGAIRGTLDNGIKLTGRDDT
jgi:hypothetical protein